MEIVKTIFHHPVLGLLREPSGRHLLIQRRVPPWGDWSGFYTLELIFNHTTENYRSWLTHFKLGVAYTGQAEESDVTTLHNILQLVRLRCGLRTRSRHPNNKPNHQCRASIRWKSVPLRIPFDKSTQDQAPASSRNLILPSTFTLSKRRQDYL